MSWSGPVSARSGLARLWLAGRARATSYPARWSMGVFALAVSGMIVIYEPLWADPSGRVLGSRHHGNDPMQMMWFLKWVPWAVAHGRNPFHSDAIFYPHGFALTWNTFAPTLGLVAAPVTFALGAAFSFALLITLGPALTALTGFWWLRRHAIHPAPAAVGALIIGFNPFVAGHMLGHLNLVFLPLVPLILMLLEDLLWRGPRRTRRTVVYLAIAAAAQAGISEEVLLIVAIAVAVTFIVAALVMPRQAAQTIGRGTGGLLGAAAIFLVVTAPLFVSQLLLARHVVLRSVRFHAVADDYLHSLSRQVLSTANGYRSQLGGAEDGVYLGWALLITLIGGIALTWWRDRPARVAAGAGIVLVALTFGDDGLPHVWLPWRLLSRIPNLQAVLPARFALATFLVIAWLLCRWVDQLLSYAHRRVPRSRRGEPSAAKAALPALPALPVLAALGISVVPILTLLPRTEATSALPPPIPFFGSAQEHRLLAADAPVLVLPVPSPGDAQAMYYQQLDSFRFRQLGGYGLVPSGATGADADVLSRLSTSATTQPRLDAPRTIASGRDALRNLHLSAIIVLRATPDAEPLVELARALTGRPPDTTAAGVSIWLLTAPAPHTSAAGQRIGDTSELSLPKGRSTGTHGPRQKRCPADPVNRTQVMTRTRKPSAAIGKPTITPAMENAVRATAVAGTVLRKAVS